MNVRTKVCAVLIVISALSVTTVMAQNRDDRTLDRLIEARIHKDAGLRARNIDVKVDEHVVTLKGWVRSRTERRRAEQLAQIRGVAHVDNQIEIGSTPGMTARAGEAANQTGEAITDGWLTAKVKTQFVGEGSLRNSDINVDTNEHVVTLRGRVMSQAGRSRAVTIARETSGVRHVVDELSVGPKR